MRQMWRVATPYLSAAALLFPVLDRPSVSCESSKNRKSSILFLGSGSSTGTPHPFHLMKPDSYFQPESLPSRRVSVAAAMGNPLNNKNYRCNPSILIRYRGGSGDGEKNILIDCGKTFREGVIRWFPKHGVSSVDAVLLSHGHADAIFGLDDIRGVQDRFISEPMNIYLSKECMDVVKQVLYYLVKDEPTEPMPVTRAVSNLKWNLVEHHKPINLFGLEVDPINVMHGEDMTSFGFIFGAKERVCYISDISRMIPESLSIIKSAPVDVLVVDALFKDREYFSHFNLKEAIDLIRLIRPKKAYLIGMSADFDYDSDCEELKALLDEGLDVELSYDGMSIDLEL